MSTLTASPLYPRAQGVLQLALFTRIFAKAFRAVVVMTAAVAAVTTTGQRAVGIFPAGRHARWGRQPRLRRARENSRPEARRTRHRLSLGAPRGAAASQRQRSLAKGIAASHNRGEIVFARRPGPVARPAAFV